LKQELFSILINEEATSLQQSLELENLRKQPLISFLFNQFFLDFPLLRVQDEEFWKRLHTFFIKLQATNLLSSVSQNFLTKRSRATRLWKKFIDYAIIIYTNMIRTTSHQEPEPRRSLNLTSNQLSENLNKLTSNEKPTELASEMKKMLKSFLHEVAESGRENEF
jgi:hypothetical protein